MSLLHSGPCFLDGLSSHESRQVLQWILPTTPWYQIVRANGCSSWRGHQLRCEREFGSMLGCPNLSKLKSGLKTKSAVGACNLPSRGLERACELRGHTVHVGNKGCGAQPRAPSHPIPRGGTHTPPNDALQPHDPGPSAGGCLWSLGEGTGDKVVDQSPIV